MEKPFLKVDTEWLLKQLVVESMEATDKEVSIIEVEIDSPKIKVQLYAFYVKKKAIKNLSVLKKESLGQLFTVGKQRICKVQMKEIGENIQEALQKRQEER